ncbi:MAG: DUF4421 family protein [Prevotella sp.]|jgi:hypothetical protein|nr:DUF4421 family protein [Prevotella sp.]
MRQKKLWMLAAILMICGTTATRASCPKDDDSPTGAPLLTQNAPTQANGPWLKRQVKALGQLLDEWAIEGVDTNYLALPRYGWQAAVTANFAGINTKVEGHNIPTYGSINVDMHSSLSGQTSVSLGYRSLSFDYSFDMANGFSEDFNLSWLDNAWGIEYRSHSTEGLHGELDASATPQSLPVSKGDTRMKATLINGYYVFNPRRYSLPAAMDQSLIQKRSAGSFTAYALLLSARLEPQNKTLSTMLGGLKKIEFYQVALGLGYGYNYTPNRGRLLIHASAAPLLVFYNKNFLTASTGIPLPDGTVYQTDISKEIETKHRYFLTGVARASVYYNISPHVHIGANALLNDVRFESASGLEMRMDDWIVNASIGVRF